MKLLRKPIGVMGIEAKAILPLYSLVFSGTYNRGKRAYIKREVYCPYL
jgi:hypothetical protein